MRELARSYGSDLKLNIEENLEAEYEIDELSVNEFNNIIRFLYNSTVMDVTEYENSWRDLERYFLRFIKLLRRQC